MTTNPILLATNYPVLYHSKYWAAYGDNIVRAKPLDNIADTTDAVVISVLFTEPACVRLLYSLQMKGHIRFPASIQAMPIG